MTIKEVRRRIGSIIGMAIGPGQFKTAINERDRSGQFRAKEQKDAIIVILEYLESIAIDATDQTEESDS